MANFFLCTYFLKLRKTVEISTFWHHTDLYICFKIVYAYWLLKLNILLILCSKNKHFCIFSGHILHCALNITNKICDFSRSLIFINPDFIKISMLLLLYIESTLWVIKTALFFNINIGFTYVVYVFPNTFMQ